MPRVIGITVAILLVVAAALFYTKDKQRHETLRAEHSALAKRDTVSRHAFDSVSYRLDSMSRLAVSGLSHWDTLTVKVARTIRVPVPGKPGETILRVDSVYKDSAFAALPDSEKVRLLRKIGDENRLVCTALINTCQAARDSAVALFRIKDARIDNLQLMYDTKPRRKCGVGFTVGIIGGVSSTFAPVSGVGGALGLTCSL